MKCIKCGKQLPKNYDDTLCEDCQRDNENFLAEYDLAEEGDKQCGSVLNLTEQWQPDQKLFERIATNAKATQGNRTLKKGVSMLNDRQKEILTEIVTEQLQVRKEEIIPNISFDELGADSLDKIELIMAAEEALGINIPNDEAEKLITVKNAVDYLEMKIE